MKTNLSRGEKSLSFSSNSFLQSVQRFSQVLVSPTQGTEHFKAPEFARCSPSCNVTDMDALFLSKLEQVRRIVDFPLHLNSAYRSVQWEHKQGRSGDSMHTLGRAVDIACTSGTQRMAIVAAALQCGMYGLGIAKNFIHLDDRSAAKANIWLY